VVWQVSACGDEQPTREAAELDIAVPKLFDSEALPVHAGGALLFWTAAASLLSKSTGRWMWPGP
jgi:hypothetical protein